MPFPNVPLEHGHYDRTLSWGDVYWFDFGRPNSNQFTMAGGHPCVIVSDIATLVGNTVVVCAGTGAEHAIPGYAYHIKIKRTEFRRLEKDTIFKVDHLYNLDRSSLIDEHYIDTLPLALMKRIYLQLLNSINVQRILY